jgi:hypothetical protein
MGNEEIRSKVAVFRAAEILTLRGYSIQVLGDTFKGLDLAAYNRRRNRIAGVQVKSGRWNQTEECDEFVAANMPMVASHREGDRWLEMKLSPSDQKVFMLVVLDENNQPTGTWYIVPSRVLTTQVKGNRTRWVGKYRRHPRLRKDRTAPVKDKGVQLFYATRSVDQWYRNRYTAIDRILRPR